MMGIAGASPAVFGAPPKIYDRPNVCVSCTHSNRVARGARDPQKLSYRFHSARSAITGSTRDARRAGSQHAIITAMPSTIAAQMHAMRFGAGISAH